MIWVTSDTHFYHKKLVTGGYRPEGYEELIFADWEKKVRPGDMVIHLGDVVFGKPEEKEATLVRLKALPGYKILLRGNHDKPRYDWAWDEVLDVDRILTERDCIFSHRPISVATWGWVPENGLIFHGHLHNGSHRRDEPQTQAAKDHRHRLVCLETMGYGVFALPDLIERERELVTWPELKKQ